MTYICGPSVLRLPGVSDPIQPGAPFEFDFAGLGDNGLAQAAALLAAEAMVVAPSPVVRPPAPQDSVTTVQAMDATDSSKPRAARAEKAQE